MALFRRNVRLFSTWTRKIFWLGRHRFDMFDLGLSPKLLLIIILVSLIGVATSSVLVLTLERQQLEDSALLAASRLSNVINASLEQAMLANDRAMIGQIVHRIADQENIDHVRILDSQGIVQISSLPAEVGKHFDYSQPTCQFCHIAGERPSNRTTIIGGSNDDAALLNVNLIYNQPQCQTCHDARNKVLGITMIESPLVDLNNQITAGFWRIALSAIVTLGLLIVLMTYVLRMLVIKPVGELARGMTEIRGGNLDYVLPRVPNHDEIGNLAETFDALRMQLRSTRDENSELQKRTHSLAILEERDRLAREMHDNLAQTLGYINLKASMSDSELTLNQIDQVRASLAELKRAAKEAYTDVRESIFNLRNAPTSGDGLLSVLTTSLVEYRAQSGIEARLLVEDERLAEFPEEVQVQVNRIIQEALTNVRKHSGAKKAWVRFEQLDHHVLIQIQDNGKGFDPAKLKENGATHFGLQIMRERAESVGGELTVDSNLGAGTRVSLQVPIFPLFEDPHEDSAYFTG